MKTNLITRLAQLIIFLAFITAFLILLMVSPDKEFSEQENRYLQQRPVFTLARLFDGSFTEEFESYITDNFPLRDRWIGLKSRIEVLLGKTENNGVFICGDGTLIARFDKPDMKLVDENISAVQMLSQNTDAKVYFALIPTAAAVWDYKLPENAPGCDQKALIAYIYSKLDKDKLSCVDIYSALYEHKDEYIYYRTDHHWTSLGAYYGYCAFAETLGYEAQALSDFDPVTMTDDFYGTVYSSSGVRWVKPDSIDIYVAPYDGVTVMNYPKSSAEKGEVYDYSYLDKKDKYAMFFGGNTPRLVISTGKEGGKLLLLRDSYADSEVPFLFDSFSEIHMLDLRYYRSSVSDYIKENGIGTVLVSYGLSNFTTDTSVFMMGY